MVKFTPQKVVICQFFNVPAYCRVYQAWTLALITQGEARLIDILLSFSVVEPPKHSAFFMSLLFLLSPIYSSLTGLASQNLPFLTSDPKLRPWKVSISSDTINNLSGILMIIRLLFHDYTSARYTAVSLNSGLFGSILLASRLHRNAVHCMYVCMYVCIYY